MITRSYSLGFLLSTEVSVKNCIYQGIVPKYDRLNIRINDEVNYISI